MSWIEKLLEETRELESPEKYFYWCGMAAISAVVKKNIWWNKYAYKLYPNIYVFLTGDSGLRKGLPITLARKLVTSTSSTKVIAGRISIQALVKELGKVHTLSTGGIIKDAQGFFCTGELAASLVQDPNCLTILTDIYDCQFNDDWKNILKNSPIDKLISPCLTMLAASNEVNLEDVVPKKSAHGGFVARTFFVHDDNKKCVNSLMYPPSKVPDEKGLSEYLKELSKLKGEFAITDGARKHHDKWYADLNAKGIKDPTGTLQRIHDGILKVAMCESLSEDINMVVKEEHLERAEMRCLQCIIGMRQVIMGSGKSEYAEQTALILKDLLKRPHYSCTRQKLLSKYWGDFDAIVLDRIVQTLLESKAIEVHCIPGQGTTYNLTAMAVEMYTKFKREEN